VIVQRLLAGLLAGEDGLVPETPDAARMALARAAARRREATNLLLIAECGCRYAAGQLGNGLGPKQARMLAVETAAELVTVAEALRRMAWLTRPERRAMARSLIARGWSRRRVADRLGVSERTVWRYLAEEAAPAPVTSARTMR